jgi:SAM-dependent methyltransferase
MNQRLSSERRYHDAEAAGRAVTYAQQPSRLRFTDSEYLNHAPWIRPAMTRLGDVSRKLVLDLGCGHGMAAIVLARQGAMVTACDLSPGYVAEARQRAKANEAIIDFAVSAGEQLPFADRSFDAIWGHAILHHLDLSIAVREIRRVLRPNGVAVFCEPWDGNPIIRWLRLWRRHTVHEKAMTQTNIEFVRRNFQHVGVQGFQFNRYVVITLR